MAETIRSNYFRKPATVPAWPPSDWEKQHLLQASESWASLAKQYKRASAWDLIIFNFRTTSVSEVNWCMAYFLGCTEVTPDRKSFKFGPSRNLYIPPASWRPGMAVPPATNTNPNETAPATARKTVIDTLKAADKYPFAFMLQGHLISSGMLRRVARAIEDGKIGVVIDPLIPQGQALYDSAENEFRLNFSTAPTNERQGLIVHEGVHAGMDLDRFGVVSGRFAEAAAYVAQALYVREHMTFDEIQNKNKLSDDGNKVMDVAWILSGKLDQGKPITPVEESLLFAAVLRTPMYRNSIVAVFDGV